MKTKQFSLKSLGIPYAFIPAAFFLGANILLNPHILSLRGINILALQTVSIAFAVMAQTLVLIVRELDMSIGAMVSMTTVIVASTMGRFHLFSIVIALIAAAALGFFSGAIVAWVKIPGIVVTLTASMLIGGLALVIMPQPGGDIDELLGDLVNGQPLLIPNSLLLLLLALLIWNYVKNTRLGVSLFASGGNPFSAYASGLSVEQAKIAAYVGSGLLSALAGIIVAGKTMTGDATIGDPYTLKLNHWNGSWRSKFYGRDRYHEGGDCRSGDHWSTGQHPIFPRTLEPLPKHRRGVNPSCSRTYRAVK